MCRVLSRRCKFKDSFVRFFGDLFGTAAGKYGIRTRMKRSQGAWTGFVREIREAPEIPPCTFRVPRGRKKPRKPASIIAFSPKFCKMQYEKLHEFHIKNVCP